MLEKVKMEEQYVCMCVCVCEREMYTDKMGNREREMRQKFTVSHNRRQMLLFSLSDQRPSQPGTPYKAWTCPCTLIGCFTRMGRGNSGVKVYVCVCVHIMYICARVCVEACLCMRMCVYMHAGVRVFHSWRLQHVYLLCHKSCLRYNQMSPYRVFHGTDEIFNISPPECRDETGC